LTGIFAVVGGTNAFGAGTNGGAVAGYGRQVWVQIVGALFVIGWNVFWTSAIMAFIKFVLRVPLRMTDEQCMVGDFAIHEEESYTFAYFNRNLIQNFSAGHDLESGNVVHGQDVPEAPARVPEKLARHAKGTTTATEPISAPSSNPDSSEISAPPKTE
jgi:hypothetical protein